MSNTPDMTIESDFKVTIETAFLADQSNIDADEYVFSYKVSITNHSKTPAQLISRHWIITDANGEKREVKGLGVIGQQPMIQTGETYQYTSHTVFSLPSGKMHGSYQMVDEAGTSFTIEIPSFECQMPRILH